MKKKVYKGVAVFLAINLLTQIGFPTAAWALTGGPSQPEVESFEPIGTTEMVDLFSGDFNYNIPLMTVPGPNGGYPINLAYHAGIGMEQEASWVGLGWNINPGVINRMMRGLPDDFQGDKVTTTTRMKPNNTFAVNFTKRKNEIAGFKLKGGMYQLYYNNYKGVGHEISLSFSHTMSKGKTTPFAKGLSLSYSSDGGLGVEPSISYSGTAGKYNHQFRLGAGLSSREGLYNISLKHDLNREVEKVGTITTDYASYKHVYNVSESLNKGTGVSFSSSSFVPNVDMKMHGTNVRLTFSSGTANAPLSNDDKRTTKGILFSTEWADKDPQDRAAYGYLYTHKASSTALKDLNREKDVPPTKDIPTMPIPVYTYDVFQATGQGIGGVFRPYRSDVGLLADGDIENIFTGGNVGLELAPGATAYHFGGEIGLNHSETFSGKWRNANHYTDIAVLEAINNTSSLNKPFYEPAYFKSAGEYTASSTTELARLHGESPARFNLKLRYTGISLKPEVTDELYTNYGNTSSLWHMASADGYRSSRAKRAQYTRTRTNEEIVFSPGYSSRAKHIYPVNQFPQSVNDPGSVYNYDRAGDSEFGKSKPGKHIGEMEVVNPDGNRYVYGIPVYNLAQKEVMFSKDDESVDQWNYPKTRGYTIGEDNTTDNDEGSDHYFNSTELPPYVHSHLLTAIYSPDYVDLTGNGPSEDDFGYYVKFNYSKVSGDYKWRIPYNQANTIPGHFSNENDDKLTYTYGEKEIYYLNSIETKTHIAKFYLQETERNDAFGATDENNSSNTFAHGNPSKALDRISLYSKANPNTPIKTAHFRYSYDLCKGVVNNKNGSGAESGKLTLTRLYFTHLGSSKGEFSPYQFIYYANENSPQAYENPNYSLAQMDRWGNYRDESTISYNIRNEDNPYVVQSKYNETNINREAGAWNLKKIKLPSGGEINIKYEADDYAYVQDKVAMQMAIIKGTADNDQGTNVHGELEDDDRYIYFELEEEINGSLPQADKDAIMNKYLAGVSQLYFKTFLKLKKYPGSTSDFAYDYVEGYADVESYGLAPAGTNGNHQMGWVKVLLEPKRENGSPVVHPFRLAGWQYLRMQRPDLFNQPNDLGGAIFDLGPITQTIKALKDAIRMFSGYYNYCYINGYCKEMQYPGSYPTTALPSPFKPSFIRVNSPDRKKWGGGHRVVEITLNDEWDTMAGEDESKYGQRYSYTLPDGSSSGVAQYEPLVGGEEIPHRLPVKYSSNKFLLNDNALYIEGPYGEQYYPGAGVGYSRVTVKSITPKDENGYDIPINKTASGITIHEFYTAKDFPIKVDHTDLQHKKYRVPVIVPFFGDQSFNNHGYSQGYRIELNDMHGKLKAVSVYPAGANLTSSGLKPTSRTEYIYQTKYTSVSSGNSLENEVDVLYADGNYGRTQLGRTYDFFVDLRENNNVTLDFGMEPNIDGTAMLAIGTLIPYLSYSEAMFRSVVTNKVISKNGILIETRQYNEGAMVATKNLMFDAETGQPLLTQVTNNFDAPVYTYNYAAHWAYNNMAGAYSNEGAMFYNINTNAGSFTWNNASLYFTPGDELAVITRDANEDVTAISKLWVTAVDNATNTVTVVTESGSPGTISMSSTDVLKIVRSGRRNQQSVMNGTIVSLSNPLQNRQFPLLASLQAYLATTNTLPTSGVWFSYTDCGTGSSIEIRYDAFENKLRLDEMPAGCRAEIIFPASYVFTDINQLKNCTFLKVGSQIIITEPNNNVISATWSDPNNCYAECIDDVLHAEAYRFRDNDWNYNYTDVGDPSVQYVSGSPQLLSSVVSGTHNPYRIGTRGIWRTESNYLYQVNRKQETPHTKISKDGTYTGFIFYNWLASGANNPRWSFVSEITQYSPYGFELENRDALSINSSALYGYSNSLPTAVGANSAYMELAYDGFEDYPTGTTTYPLTGGHGHIQFTAPGSATPALSGDAHTGSYGLEVLSTTPARFTCTSVSTTTNVFTNFTPIAGKEYVVSTWVKAPSGTIASLAVTIGAGSPVTYSSSSQATIIDGWQRLEARFTVPAAGTQVKIDLSSNAPLDKPCVFDDIRIHPFKGGIKTYVYDPRTLWLLAELDNQNFATFYNYDEEGALVQVKKETIKGVVTLRSSRNNIKPQ